jgi:hypothetical protein
MRRIASLLGIAVSEERWPALVRAATFSEMKRNADRTAPDTDLDMWRENARFFHSGTSGKWRTELSPASLACYEDVVRRREPRVMIDWLEHGARATGDPRSL